MNLDFLDHTKVWTISLELRNKSDEYAKARIDYASLKYEFDLQLATSMASLRQKKPNLGIDTAQIMMLELGSDYVHKTYKELLEKENLYKGLEKIIDALKTQITLAQSLIKNQTNQGAN